MSRINWFEGGRRITQLLQVVIGLCALTAIFLSRPYIFLSFETTAPDSPWTITTNDCSYQTDGRKELPSGLNVGETSSTLCFRAANFNGEMLVPYRLGAGNTWYGAPATSELAEERQLQDEARNYVRREWWKQWRENISEGLAYGFGLILLLAALSWVIGWIIRGFFGIPMGKDHRTPNEAD